VAVNRPLELAIAGVLLVLALPLMLTTAVVVRIFLGSPVVFRQMRPGLGGRPFTLLKFRTMREAVGPDGRPLPDQARMTRIGRFLRRTSLDELPGLWNVIRGDMSLVGPRPLLLEYLAHYDERQMRRHEVRPGLTGWAQVNGRNALSWEEKFEHDVWYVDHRSLALDVKILMMTAGAALSGRGVSQSGQATMERFRGSDRRGDPPSAPPPSGR
jgi:lipopolysaccharide/colanic/teichoic acid biosynthesis glycosyltransferase